MFSKEEQQRYNRHTLLPEIGEGGQLKFKKAKVLVIGAGGLGCPALQYLAAAGVGEIGILDGDRVEASNLQRQVLYTTPDIGKLKADCAAEQLKAINPFIAAHALPYWLDHTNALELTAQYDLILDGSDNFETRYLVNDSCVMNGKPFVSGSVYRFEGQLSVFNYKGGPTYRCLYPEPNESGNCEVTGVLGVLPGTIGCLMAAEALKIISGAGTTLSGTLLVYNALESTFSRFSFGANETNKKIKELIPSDTCTASSPEISVEEFAGWKKQGKSYQLIDVREANEYERENISGILIPLSTLSSRIQEIRKDIPVIIHCQSGMRSMKAVEQLKEKGFRNIQSLKGGIVSYLRHAEALHQ
jgi:molybdopterin/thiamine biosynthesis adenylyltransferase/rhodanese-related sulfurtransferase